MLANLIQQAFNQTLSENEYTVEYIYKQPMPNEVKVADSIELITIDNNGNESKLKIANANNSFNLNQELAFAIYVKGDSKQATLTFHTEGSEKKLIFNSGIWHSVINDEAVEIPNSNIKVQETTSYKTIAGYLCKKYMVKDFTGVQDFEVWVTDKLPNSLMPGGGFKPFPGAVLEMYFPAKHAGFVAQKITKLI